MGMTRPGYVDTLMSGFSTTSHTGNVIDAANIKKE
jgi:hypothetical protein